MKRCPECDSVFPDTEKFCELDGAQLVDADDEGNDGTEQEIIHLSTREVDQPARRPESSQKTVVIVAVAGVAIGLVLFLVYYAMTRQPTTENSNQSSLSSSMVQPPGPLLPSHPSPHPSASPSVEPSPSPSATPSPSTNPSPERVELSSNPISTAAEGKTRTGPVTIRLTDGSSIEADEAWQTGEGIWYRRRGIVTLLNPNQVKTIERLAPATPLPSASQTPTR
jgi:cytoskeletal protein RodZ